MYSTSSLVSKNGCFYHWHTLTFKKLYYTVKTYEHKSRGCFLNKSVFYNMTSNTWYIFISVIILSLVYIVTTKMRPRSWRLQQICYGCNFCLYSFLYTSYTHDHTTIMLLSRHITIANLKAGIQNTSWINLQSEPDFQKVLV